MTKFTLIAGYVLLVTACGCTGKRPDTLTSGMRLNSALDLLRRNGLAVEENTGDQVGRTFQISSPASDDAICFHADDGTLNSIFWYKNWRADIGKPKAKRTCEYVLVDRVTFEQIRLGLRKRE